jgi:hypothetical protein
MLIALRVRARQERVRVDARATGRRPARQFILRARETSLANFEKVVGSESFLTTSQNKEKAGRFCLTVDNFPEPSQNKKKAGRFCLTVENFPEPSRIQIRIRGKSCLCVGSHIGRTNGCHRASSSYPYPNPYPSPTNHGAVVIYMHFLNHLEELQATTLKRHTVA